MKFTFQLTLLIILFFSSLFTSFAQQRPNMQNFEGGSVSGRVLDLPTKEPIEYANIVLISRRDSSIVNGTVTDKNGMFKLDKLRPGRFYSGC